MNKMQSVGARKLEKASRTRRSGSFQPAKRRLALAIHLIFAIGAGESFAAPCILDGATITSSVSNSIFCDNSGSLTVSPGGTLTNTTTGTLNNLGTVVNNSFLTNNGLINNSGTLTNTGILNGSGALNNTGTVVVAAGGTASIANSNNLSNGTLTGGTWLVDGSGSSKSKSSLAIGSGAITTNNANIELIGLGANFSQIRNLANNNGSLAVSGGASFTSASLFNTGTVTVASGGIASITSSNNLSNGTLTGGTWVVNNTAGTSKLTVGSGAITTNSANIELIGSGALASFSQLSGLANNTGSLTIGAGANLGSKASLYNTGTLTVKSGGVATILGSKNVSGGTLAGGTWVVDASGGSVASLAVGLGAISTNKANVTLIGANASFAQLSALANNQGTLTIGQGANFGSSVALNNTGTIVTAAGGTLNTTAPGGKSAPLTNNGSIENNGTITAASNISGSGTLNNFGTLNVLSGATVQIANSKNFSGGTLTGGNWVIDSSGGHAAVLSIGSGNITTNNANIALIGSGASFAQLAGLANNNGSLAVSGGANFTSASLHNTGTVKVGFGSNLNITNSDNLSKGTLTGGTWVVDGSGSSKSKTSLTIGSGAITTNNANIELIGLGANFSQIGNLANNSGSLAVRGGASFTSASLYNTGTLAVASGGIANITSSNNLSNGTLTGGNWVVDNTAGTSKLTVGSGAITTNNANIELIGSGALSSFSQLSGLANNTGSLTIGAGASLGSKASLYNTGTLTVTSGGAANILSSKNVSGGTLAGGTWVVDGSGGSAASLAVGLGAITTNKANVALIGANASFAQLSSLANNQGTLTIGSGANLNTSAALNNTGTIVTTAGGGLEVSSSKQKLLLTNNGAIANAGTITGNGLGSFTNAGTLAIDSTGSVSGFNSFIQTAGVTTLKEGASLSANNVQFLGGKLTGSGTIDPPNTIVIGSNAVVEPGKLLTLQGNTAFNGELDIGIFGASDYGILNVLGTIDFGVGSRIDFNFDPGFSLTDSSYLFRFLSASDDILGLQNLTFDYNGLDSLYSSHLNLECQASGCDYALMLTRNEDPGRVPEPGTLLLTSLGLFGLAYGRRKMLSGRG